MIVKRIFGVIYIGFALWYAYIRWGIITGIPDFSFDYVSSWVIPIGLIILGVMRLTK